MGIELLLKNGVLFNNGEWIEGDLLVDEGKIIGMRKSSAEVANEVIDASGKYIIPGLVDAHVHFRDPGYTHKEDYATGTMAAARGGVTTVLDQPNTDPVPNTVERYKKHIQNAESKAYIDFNSMASPSHIDQVKALSDIGTACFKIFQKSTVYPYDTEASIPESNRILEGFTAVAKTGKPCSVHPHDHEIYQSLIAKAKASGQFDAKRFCEITGNELVYSSTVPQLLYFQEKTGVTYYALHCNHLDYIEMVRRAKRRGAKVIADCLYFALVPPEMNKFDILKNHLTVAVTKEQQEACWAGVLDGTIDFIDTDHAPHTVEEIKRGLENPESMALGLPGIEHFFSLLLTEVNRGKISLGRLIELVSVNPAKAFGLYPNKGSLQIGTDADIVIIDLKQRTVIDGKNLYTKSGWTPYEGREVQGVPTHTILRGKIVCEFGKVIGRPGDGKFVPVIKKHNQLV
jgi:dihydroorotase (multifunctional complex type)